MIRCDVIESLSALVLMTVSLVLCCDCRMQDMRTQYSGGTTVNDAALDFGCQWTHRKQTTGNYRALASSSLMKGHSEKAALVLSTGESSRDPSSTVA